MGNGSLAWANERKKIKNLILKLLDENEILREQAQEEESYSPSGYKAKVQSIRDNIDSIKVLLAKI